MNQWILLAIVVAIVFAAMFFVMSPAMASSATGPKVAGSWMNGTRETKTIATPGDGGAGGTLGISEIWS